MLSIRQIVAPVDFSEPSEWALKYAVDLAAKLGAAVTLVHAYQIPVYSFPDSSVIASPEVAAQLSTAAQRKLDDALLKYKDRGVKLAAVLREGVAWEEVNAVAKDIGADLIVAGTHGRRGLPRALLGSVAEKIVRTSPLPVLIVPGRKGE